MGNNFVIWAQMQKHVSDSIMALLTKHILIDFSFVLQVVRFAVYCIQLVWFSINLWDLSISVLIVAQLKSHIWISGANVLMFAVHYQILCHFLIQMRELWMFMSIWDDILHHRSFILLCVLEVFLTLSFLQMCLVMLMNLSNRSGVCK